MRAQYLSLGLATTATAAKLYVSSYGGEVTSLEITSTPNNFNLTELARYKITAPQPSWLEQLGDVIYCLSENYNGANGSITVLDTSDNGLLSAEEAPLDTPVGPVASIAYNDGKALAMAYYAGSAVTSFEVNATGSLKPLQTFTFSGPIGPVAARQSSPHPHHVILDPSGSFIVVPDLGSDLLRVFSIDGNKLTEEQPFPVQAGSGPRHGAFLQTEFNTTYFFLISELANTVASYAVTPADGTLKFEEVFRGDVFNTTAPAGTASSELRVTPDSKFLITSTRNDTLFSIPNVDKNNSTRMPSDTLQTWTIDHTTGKLSLRSIAPAGGWFPRQFTLNKDGSLVAVGLQYDGNIVLWQRDVDSGVFAPEPLASFKIASSEPTSIVWDE